MTSNMSIENQSTVWSTQEITWANIEVAVAFNFFSIFSDISMWKVPLDELKFLSRLDNAICSKRPTFTCIYIGFGALVTTVADAPM